LIITDDQGYGEFGFTGNKNVLTPNMDKLAEQSAVFRNFAVAPACSPTRSSLMMGRNHFKTGVWGVGEACNILDDEGFMPQFFKKAGYTTALFGKGDSVQRREQRPWHLGVDESSVVWGYDHKDPRMFEKEIVGNEGKLVVVNKTGYTCDINVDDTIDFIRRSKGKPWWIDLAFIIPHQPWEAAPEYEKIYLDKGYKSAKRKKSGVRTLRSSFKLKSGTRPSGPGGTYDGTYIEDYQYVVGSGDLDESNGRFQVTPEFPKGTYCYILTEEFPVIPLAFRGNIASSFAKSGPGGGAGGPLGPGGPQHPPRN